MPISIFFSAICQLSGRQVSFCIWPCDTVSSRSDIAQQIYPAPHYMSVVTVGLPDHQSEHVSKFFSSRCTTVRAMTPISYCTKSFTLKHSLTTPTTVSTIASMCTQGMKNNTGLPSIRNWQPWRPTSKESKYRNGKLKRHCDSSCFRGLLSVTVVALWSVHVPYIMCIQYSVLLCCWVFFIYLFVCLFSLCVLVYGNACTLTWEGDGSWKLYGRRTAMRGRNSLRSLSGICLKAGLFTNVSV